MFHASKNSEESIILPCSHKLPITVLPDMTENGIVCCFNCSGKFPVNVLDQNYVSSFGDNNSEQHLGEDYIDKSFDKGARRGQNNSFNNGYSRGMNHHSRQRNFQSSRDQNFKMSRRPNFQSSRGQDFESSRDQNFQSSRDQNFKMSRRPNFQSSRGQDFHNAKKNNNYSLHGNERQENIDLNLQSNQNLSLSPHSKRRGDQEFYSSTPAHAAQQEKPAYDSSSTHSQKNDSMNYKKYGNLINTLTEHQSYRGENATLKLHDSPNGNYSDALKGSKGNQELDEESEQYNSQHKYHSKSANVTVSDDDTVMEYEESGNSNHFQADNSPPDKKYGSADLSLSAVKSKGRTNVLMQGLLNDGSLKMKQDEVSDFYFCFTCDKWVPHKIFNEHKKHKVQNTTESFKTLDATQDAIKQKLTEGIRKSLIEGSRVQTVTQLAEDMQSDIQNTLESENKLSVEIEKRGTDLLKDISALPKVNSVVAHHTNQKSIKQLQKKCESCTDNVGLYPWLLSSWFKSSVGILLCGLERSKIKCLVESTDKKSFSHVTLQGDRIKFSSFGKNTPPASAHVLPFGLFESLQDDNGLRTFMDISLQNAHLGTVLIRPLNQCFWNKQFKFMAIGILGKSYKGTPFHRVCLKGSKGHHIWGGDYSHRSGKGGMRVLDEDDNIDSLVSHPVTPGLIAARYGVDDRSTIFRIYLKEGDSDFDKNSFALVEEGLSHLQVIGDSPNISNAVISNTGLIVNLKD